jgi:trimethylamine--corrinoid protein Co-methyltransferase
MPSGEEGFTGCSVIGENGTCLRVTPVVQLAGNCTLFPQEKHMEIRSRTVSGNRCLSDIQIRQVDEYALQLMETIGCRMSSAEGLDILGRAGCDVSDPGRVKVPRRLVRDALAAAPRSIDVYNRDGEPAMTLSEGACYYGTGSDCPTTIDLDTGERRQSMKEDVARLARFVDALPNMDFAMSFGIANNAPSGTNFVHQYEAMLLNTRKPILVTGHGRNDMVTMIEMAAAAVGGMDALRARPPLVLYTEPLSPLVHTTMGIDKGLVCCEYGVPVIYIGSPMLGATSPALLEATLVQAVAEALVGLVVFQSKQPGAKFIFGGDATVLDMQSGIFSYGAPELNTLNDALADMAHFYRLPFFCIAGSTDAKTLDAQAGMEYALSLYNATLNGCNLIHDCGYLESGLTSSFESVLFADETVSMIRHLLRPLRFDDDSVPLRLMDVVGPGGGYLAEEHTLNNYRETFWFPRYLDRRRFERWQAAGSKDIRQALNQKAKAILATHVPAPLAGAVVRRIGELVARHRPDV